MFENDLFNLALAIFGVIGIVACLSLLVVIVAWPFFSLSDINSRMKNMDACQDDIVEALDEIIAKLNEEKL